ncbi:unnamed protein product [Boreogadus saida]
MRIRCLNRGFSPSRPPDSDAPETDHLASSLGACDAVIAAAASDGKLFRGTRLDASHTVVAQLPYSDAR